MSITLAESSSMLNPASHNQAQTMIPNMVGSSEFISNIVYKDNVCSRIKDADWEDRAVLNKLTTALDKYNKNPSPKNKNKLAHTLKNEKKRLKGILSHLRKEKEKYQKMMAEASSRQISKHVDGLVFRLSDIKNYVFSFFGSDPKSLAEKFAEQEQLHREQINRIKGCLNEITAEPNPPSQSTDERYEEGRRSGIISLDALLYQATFNTELSSDELIGHHSLDEYHRGICNPSDLYLQEDGTVFFPPNYFNLTDRDPIFRYVRDYFAPEMVPRIYELLPVYSNGHTKRWRDKHCVWEDKTDLCWKAAFYNSICNEHRLYSHLPPFEPLFDYSSWMASVTLNPNREDDISDLFIGDQRPSMGSMGSMGSAYLIYGERPLVFFHINDSSLPDYAPQLDANLRRFPSPFNLNEIQITPSFPHNLKNIFITPSFPLKFPQSNNRWATPSAMEPYTKFWKTCPKTFDLSDLCVNHDASLGVHPWGIEFTGMGKSTNLIFGYSGYPMTPFSFNQSHISNIHCSKLSCFPSRDNEWTCRTDEMPGIRWSVSLSGDFNGDNIEDLLVSPFEITDPMGPLTYHDEEEFYISKPLIFSQGLPQRNILRDEDVIDNPLSDFNGDGIEDLRMEQSPHNPYR